MGTKTVAAGAFKQGCLALIDEVAGNKSVIVITKRGRPVARLVPIEDPREHEQRLLASWRGRAEQFVSDDELLEPSSSLTSWQSSDEDDA